jgi:hypothetical protein
MKRKILIFASIFFIVLIASMIGLRYLSSYIGYYGYDKHTVRRYSDSIEESMRRKVFEKKAHFLLESDSIEIKDVFIERAFLWGSSAKETVLLKSNDTIENNFPKFPYQVVVAYEKEQKYGKVSVFSASEFYTYKPFTPLAQNKMMDTIRFNLIVENKYRGVIKIW